MDRLREKASDFPNQPGVYKFYNSEGVVIYVGKARDLRKRALSYFNIDQQSVKTKILLSKAENLDCIVVDSEQDALLLENELIKKFKPRYNILLKDDKSFPWICVCNEAFPRIFMMRNPVKDGSAYFGPYASVRSAKSVMYYLKQIYKIRSCKLSLTEVNIKSGKLKVCLEYHIGRCLAPCIGKQARAEYDLQVKQIRYILKGRIKEVIRYAKTQMLRYANDLKFEKAEEVKNQLDWLVRYQAQSAVVHSKITNVDVFTYRLIDKFLFLNYLRVINGNIVSAYSIDKKLSEINCLEETFCLFINQIRKKFQSKSNYIFLPHPIGFEIPHAKCIVPTRGEKLKLLKLSEKNCENYLKTKVHLFDNAKNGSKIDELMKKIQIDLRLPIVPTRMECYDNSNIQGTSPVASCSVFINAKPAKREYRHYNVKTVIGPNDYATFEEILTRRFTRLLEEEQNLIEKIPQLIIIDGGKGQLHIAYKILCKFKLEEKISMIGIAKRLEEIYYPGDNVPIYLDKRSETLRIIQRMRDEAHRFGITFHRKKRTKSGIRLQLEGVKGIGKKTIELLYEKYGTIENIKNAEDAEIVTLIGNARMIVLKKYFEEVIL